MRKTRTVALICLLVLVTGTVQAAEATHPEVRSPAPPPEMCRVPEAAASVEGRLPVVSAGLAAHLPLRIVVVGTASSMGAGLSDPQKAYPERLQAALAQRLPVKVTVINKSKLHDIAVDMVQRFATDVIGEQPALVIWQTGTTDAVRHVEAKEFDTALQQGIDLLTEKKIDVILMDAQYSRHTATLINFRPYLQDMRLIAKSHDIMLFPRNAVMEYWADKNYFGADEGTKLQLQHHDELIHDCIAELLAWMIDVASAPVDEPTTATSH